jgi:DNA-binding transcriptional regulator YiaG
MPVIYFSPVKGWTAQKIKRVREAAGLTQAQLADWLGVTKMHVSHLEQNVRPPGPQTVRLLCVLSERVKACKIGPASHN